MNNPKILSCNPHFQGGIARQLCNFLSILPLLSLLGCSDPAPAAAPEVISVDFDAAMHSLNFKLEGDDNGTVKGNGIPDSTEMALVATILSNPALDLSATGGVNPRQVRFAYQATLAQADDDLSLLTSVWGEAPTVIAGYSMLGKASFLKIKAMTAGFGADLAGDYQLALALEPFLSADGDADGDGITNAAEYAAAEKAAKSLQQVRAIYLSAALDPKQAVGEAVNLPTVMTPK